MASFDENGKYIKTDWKAGDKITATKLNKIEESIEAVNDNDISRHVEADARLDALEAKDVAHDKELTNIKNTIASNKAAAELGDYEINSRMQFLEKDVEQAVNDMNSAVTTMRNEMNTHTNTVNTNVSNKISTFETEFDAEVAGLKAVDEVIQDDISEIQNDVLEIQNDILENQLNTGAQIESLQEQNQTINDFMNQFDTSNIEENGYYVLPGGLTLQWGTLNASFDDSSVCIGEHAYNTPFKTELFSLFIDTNGFGEGAGGTSASHNVYSIAYNYQLDKFKFEIKSLTDAAMSGIIIFSWFAIGV